MDRKRILIIGAVVLVAMAAVVLLRPAQDATSTSQGAPYTGNAKVPEGSLKPAGSVFVGFDNLFNYGVTVDQIDALQRAFRRYAPTGGTTAVVDIGQYNANALAPDPHDRLYRPSIVTSVVVNDKTTYKVKIYYWGTGNIQLLMYDASGKTKLFDSGTVSGDS